MRLFLICISYNLLGVVMLKKKIFKKISLIICCLLIITILIIFPKENEMISFKTKNDSGIIYLLDEDDYLARVDYRYNATNTKDLIKEIIKVLTINDEETIAIRKGFRAIIPNGTKLKNIDIKDNIAIINFSDEIIKVEPKYEERMIEALIYSITTLKDIKGIKILVEDDILKELPHSKKRLEEILTRDFKINKEYDLKSMNNINETTIYYLANKNNYIYYKPVTKYSNEEKEKIEIIIDELKSSSIYSTNLISYINEDTKLINYEILDKSLLLNFNDAILSDINSSTITEEVTYAINMSIQENYDVDSVCYYIDDQIFNNYFLLLG